MKIENTLIFTFFCSISKILGASISTNASTISSIISSFKNCDIAQRIQPISGDQKFSQYCNTPSPSVKDFKESNITKDFLCLAVLSNVKLICDSPTNVSSLNEGNYCSEEAYTPVEGPICTPDDTNNNCFNLKIIEALNKDESLRCSEDEATKTLAKVILDTANAVKKINTVEVDGNLNSKAENPGVQDLSEKGDEANGVNTEIEKPNLSEVKTNETKAPSPSGDNDGQVNDETISVPDPVADPSLPRLKEDAKNLTEPAAPAVVDFPDENEHNVPPKEVNAKDPHIPDTAVNPKEDAIDPSVGNEDEEEDDDEYLDTAFLKNPIVPEEPSAQVLPSLEKSVLPGPDAAPATSNFFSYFILLSIVTIVAYLVFHNKKKILGMILEGRRQQSSRRRSGGREYRKLDSNLEDTMESGKMTSMRNVIY